ncbi:hypothetical protein AB0J80_31160 [Actinoplanes sp. NPDC049548]|uniref:hypothetical protein n=1 Tax=Actinoplanes sp. NPDC049548 TaxID=3155152 RepID=UPI0034432937
MSVIARFLGKPGADEPGTRNRPAWLKIVRGLAGTAVALFIVAPSLVVLLEVWLILRGQFRSADFFIPWLIAVDLGSVLTEPVRDFLTAHAAGLPVSGRALWRGWELIGVLALTAGFTGALWARTTRIVVGLSTVATACSGSSGSLRELILGLAAAWLAVEALLVYRRSDRFRRAVRKATRPQPPPLADDRLEITVFPDHRPDR